MRSAAWSAAYQGLAGLAVDCEPPAREVDRQLAVWHVLRDAVAEAALWRRATRLAATATAGSSPPRDAVLARAGLEAVIGLSDSGLLPVRAVRVPFRQVYEIAPATRPVASLSEFAAARRRTLELAAGLAPLVPAPTIGDLYWRGIPFAESGQVRWTIFAPGVGTDVRQRRPGLRVRRREADRPAAARRERLAGRRPRASSGPSSTTPHGLPCRTACRPPSTNGRGPRS